VWGNDIRERFPDWGTDAALARWPESRATLTVGQDVRGEIIARAPFGVWVDIGAGHPALLLVPEMAGANERRFTFDDYPSVGVFIKAKIISLGEDAKINLCQEPTRNSNCPSTSDRVESQFYRLPEIVRRFRMTNISRRMPANIHKRIDIHPLDDAAI
jgi:predicted RNA-binding protein with RPS1 domain